MLTTCTAPTIRVVHNTICRVMSDRVMSDRVMSTPHPLHRFCAGSGKGGVRPEAMDGTCLSRAAWGKLPGLPFILKYIMCVLSVRGFPGALPSIASRNCHVLPVFVHQDSHRE